MELHAEGCVFLVSEPHDLTVGAARRDGERCLITVEIDDQRMIATGVEAVGEVFENSFTVMDDLRGLAMERPSRTRDLRSEERRVGKEWRSRWSALHHE